MVYVPIALYRFPLSETRRASHSIASRRQFPSDVGRSMLVAVESTFPPPRSGIGIAWGDASAAERLSFGRQERLAALLQETAPEKLLPQLADLIRSGTQLQELVGAAALANARTIRRRGLLHRLPHLHGPHAVLRMADAMPTDEQALPVIKVLYRNTNRIQDTGKAADEALPPITGRRLRYPLAEEAGLWLRDAVRSKDTGAGRGSVRRDRADARGRLRCAAVRGAGRNGDPPRRPADRALGSPLIVGREHATTLLRQSVRYCVEAEEYAGRAIGSPTLLPKLLDQHKLRAAPGTRAAEDDGPATGAW